MICKICVMACGPSDTSVRWSGQSAELEVIRERARRGTIKTRLSVSCVTVYLDSGFALVLRMSALSSSAPYPDEILDALFASSTRRSATISLR
ncbi:hypothetical protein C8R45DRAFT_1104079 [Mycena sanguinolenta]|nr:hypothetical protein C8R45DRAFT_1104079 [Mycena sanguinolenta]